MLYEHPNYRSFIKTALAERAKKSAGYSLRSFAQKIGVSNSFLSEVLSEKKSLSVELAFKIAVKLELTEVETQYLCLLVQLEHEKNPEFRDILMSRLRDLQPKCKAYDLSADLFRVVSDWYHFAILDMTFLPGFAPDSLYISKKLGISKMEADLAIERLLRLNLLEWDENGNYRKRHNYIGAQSDVPDRAFKTLHRQILEKAIDSLDTQTPKTRMSATDFVPIDSKYLPTIDRLSQEFSAAVMRLSELSKTKDSVYALSVHFFNLTANEEVF